METPSQNLTQALARINEKIDNTAMYQWLQLNATQRDDHLLYHLKFQEAHIGNPVIRAIHGGVVSAFLESAAWLNTFGGFPEDVRLKTTSTHTSYLRSTKAVDMTARVFIRRLGRRIGFLEATCWQEDEEAPVAFAEVGIRIMRPDE